MRETFLLFNSLFMYNYTLHFIAALVLATLFPLFFSSSWKKRLLFAFVCPSLFYCLFFNYDYILYLGGASPIIITYLGVLFISTVCLFFSRYKVIESIYVKREPNLIFIVLLFCLQIFFLLYSFTIPWAVVTFPFSNIEAVLFTVFAGTNEGAEEFVLSSFSAKVIRSSIPAIVIVFAVQFLIAFSLKKNKLNLCFKLWKLSLEFYGPALKRYLFQIQKCGVVVLFVYCIILSLILPGIIMSAPFKALFQQPIDSELYRNHYIHPDSIQISSESPKNLIVILLESMETNFAQYTPEIISLEKEHTNFAPGGESVSGTSWTIAGITGKLCGIPLNMPMGIGEYLGKLPTYLPGAKCLMNVLAEKKYNQIYMQGSSGDFTQKRTFWTVHGNVAVHDIEYYKGVGKIPNDYHVFWGFEDRKLYQFAREELDSLYKQGKPFALYMLTIDTHQPEGYVDSACEKEFKNVDGKLPKAIRCSSKQLYDFISWAKDQPWYENTVISVMGDHTMSVLSVKANVPPQDSLYWTNFIINSSVQKSMKPRQYSSLDMFPTLLEAMGFELENRGIALGRSLFSDSLTMLELYGRQTLDSLLRERSIQYDKFLFGEK